MKKEYIYTEKVRYKDLSGWLKVAILGGWLVFFVYALAFATGFLEGLLI